MSVQTLLETVIQTPQKVHGCFENVFQKILGLFEAFVLPFGAMTAGKMIVATQISILDRFRGRIYGLKYIKTTKG